MYNGVVHAEKAEQAGAKLIAEAVVYRVEADNKGLITAVHYKDPNGNSTRVTGKLFVLAANGIETPKLMLMSTADKFPHGVGNSSDQVGRNLMDHPGTGVTFLANEPLWPGRGPMEMTSIVNFRDGAFRSDYAAKKLHLSNGVPTMSVTADLLKKGLTGAELDRQIRDRAARTLNINSFHEHLAGAAEPRGAFGGSQGCARHSAARDLLLDQRLREEERGEHARTVCADRLAVRRRRGLVRRYVRAEQSHHGYHHHGQRSWGFGRRRGLPHARSLESVHCQQRGDADCCLRELHADDRGFVAETGRQAQA